MAAHDAGVEVTCPGCGETTLQKAMIPLLGNEGHSIRYACQTCARALAVSPADEASAPSDASGG